MLKFRPNWQSIQNQKGINLVEARSLSRRTLHFHGLLTLSLHLKFKCNQRHAHRDYLSLSLNERGDVNTLSSFWESISISLKVALSARLL
jgi:hypothetical protein